MFPEHKHGAMTVSRVDCSEKITEARGSPSIWGGEGSDGETVGEEEQAAIYLAEAWSVWAGKNKNTRKKVLVSAFLGTEYKGSHFSV